MNQKILVLQHKLNNAATVLGNKATALSPALKYAFDYDTLARCAASKSVTKDDFETLRRAKAKIVNSEGGFAGMSWAERSKAEAKRQELENALAALAHCALHLKDAQ